MDKTAKPQRALLRKKRWLWLFLPLLPLIVIEFFVDPFPDSIWFLRITHTQYLVHVRADLTIDGEKLVMERTIRCFKPVDYRWFPSVYGHMNILSGDGQSGNTIAATTKSGRFFAITGINACVALAYQPPLPNGDHEFIDPEKHDVKPLVLSRGDIQTPVVFEIFGGRAANYIDAYIARNLLRQGYHGVQLNDLIIEKIPGSLWVDWTEYDWFGELHWTRPFNPNPFSFHTTRYYWTAYLIPIPVERWSKFAQLDLSSIRSFTEDGHEHGDGHEQYRKDMHQYVTDLLNAPSDVSIQGGLMQFRLFSSFQAAGYISLVDSTLVMPPPNDRDYNNRLSMEWSLENLISCKYTEVGPISTCDNYLTGVLRMQRQAMDHTVVVNGSINDTYRFEGLTMVAFHTTDVGYLRHSDKTLFFASTTDAYLGRD